MDYLLILNKFLILIYLVFKYGRGDTKDIPVVILFVLIYVCLNMLYHILKKESFRTVLLFLSVLLLAGCSTYLDILFVMLLPTNLFELTVRFRANFVFPAAAAAATAFIIRTEILPEYFLICFFNFLVFSVIYRTFARLDLILKENDELKEKNSVFFNRLNRNAQYESQIKHMSQLEERNKIAQEIHDRVGHTISGSLMQLEAAKILIDKDRSQAEDMLQSVIGRLRDGMENIRATLRNLKPSSEQLGINRIKLLLDEFSTNNRIKTNIIYKGNLDNISYNQWRIIHENTNEALTNALKYSGATVITVRIEVLNKLIKTEVRDNGAGSTKISKGLGISGIEERCGGVGGKVVIDGSDGFSIITLLPLEEVE